jgi:hypothetical protein
VYPADHGSHVAVVIGISFILDRHLSMLSIQHVQTCSVRRFVGTATLDIFCFHHANWHSLATLTEVFPWFLLSCKANARV